MEFSPFISSLMLILLMTCFVKIITTLSILRFGLGLSGVDFSVVIFTVSLALSWFIMEPQFAPHGIVQIVSGQASVKTDELQNSLKPFLEKNSDRKILARMERLHDRLHPKDSASVASTSAAEVKSSPQKERASQVSDSVLTVSFVLSELQEAFSIGFIIVLPFLVIDLLVANLLMMLGITQLSVMFAALPFKILLFFAVDGWTLLSEKLVMTYV